MPTKLLTNRAIDIAKSAVLLAALAFSFPAAKAGEPPPSPAESQLSQVTAEPAAASSQPKVATQSKAERQEGELSHFSVAGQTIGLSTRKDLNRLARQKNLYLATPDEKSAETAGTTKMVKGPLLDKGVEQTKFSYDRNGILQGADIVVTSAKAQAVFNRLVRNGKEVPGKKGLFQQGASYARMVKVEPDNGKSATGNIRIELMTASLLDTRKKAERSPWSELIALGIILLICYVAVKITCKILYRFWKLISPDKVSKPVTIRFNGSMSDLVHMAKDSVHAHDRAKQAKELERRDFRNRTMAAGASVAGAAIAGGAAYLAYAGSEGITADTSLPDFNPANGLPMMGSVDVHGNIFGTTSMDDSSNNINPANGLPMVGGVDIHGNSFGTTDVDDMANSWQDDSYDSSTSYHQDFGGGHDFSGGYDYTNNSF